MPKTILIFSVFILFLLVKSGFGQSTSFSQKSSSLPDWQFNYNLGFTQFYGDASNNGYFTKFSGESAFGTGLTARKFFSPTLALGISFYYSGLKSHKQKAATGETVDFELTGSYYDIGPQLYVNLSNLFWGETSRKVSFYSTIGLGYAGWNTELNNVLSGLVIKSGDAVNGTDTKKAGAVMPIGLGLDYLLGNNWSLNFEINLHTVLNDDVDMWSDGFAYDQPLYTQVGISYLLFSGNKTKTPKVKGERPQNNKPINQNVKNLDEIPLFDYKKQPEKKSSNVSGEIVPLVIDSDPFPVISAQKGLVYRVQILAMSHQISSVNSLKNKFGLSTEVFENFQDGVYRYSVGSFSNFQQALAYSQEMKQRGIHDAFVVVYQDNRRVKLTESLKK